MNEDADYVDEPDEDEDPEKWVCAFPSICVMPAEHMRSECHTAADHEEAERIRATWKDSYD